MSDTFQRFKAALRSGAPDSSFVIESEASYTLYYVPFEYLNVDARIVVVGITPGPDQMKCAYSAARRLLGTSKTDEEILCEVKKSCAFFGMRPKMNEMLDHFAIPKCIGATSASSLWQEKFQLIHTTSLVPNAAFKNGKYFNGPFSDVLKVPLLHRQFEELFITAIRRLSKRAVYIAMGPVVDEGLSHCVSAGVLGKEQVLGYFPHASGQSGSQFEYFLRRKRLTDLRPGDPVRHRARDLDAAYERLERNVKVFCAGNAG